ncbi:hypothetical protein V6N12_050764 [Hibiscus sabdariffa]|uniref:Uncharacterized protein n=1 Tax=Hibiscus sabdariffa TaxID=183260 RepID=A0ABR2GF36_9ROSI
MSGELDSLARQNHMDASTSGGNMDTHSQVPYYEVELSMEEDAMDDSNGMEENGSVAQELPHPKRAIRARLWETLLKLDPGDDSL